MCMCDSFQKGFIEISRKFKNKNEMFRLLKSTY